MAAWRRHPGQAPRARPAPRLLVAAFAVAEIALAGWWAWTGVTLVAVLLQVPLITAALVVGLGLRFRRFRLSYVAGIADAAAARERMRLAEEMHDVLGHELSLVALRAAALQVHATGPAQEAAGALRRDVETVVVRLRDALAVLREDEEQVADGAGSAARLPAAGSIDQLVRRATASGARIDVHGELPPDLPMSVERTLLGVVREGLTNAARHASGARVELRFTVADGRVEVVVLTNPAARRPPSPEASGLATSRRRVALLGGDLTAGVEGEVHLLVVRVPVRPELVPPASPDLSLPTPGRVAHRSPLRATVRSALFPATVGVAVLLAFYTWATAGATVEEADFAAIAPGLAEPVAAQRLPDRQAPVRLTPGPLHPRDWTCGYWTDGNFPFGTAAFEVCFRSGVVVRTADLRRESPW